MAKDDKQGKTAYQQVISDLETKRDQLNALIAALKEMKGASLGSFVGVVGAGVSHAATSAEFRGDEFFGLKIPDAAAKYLSIVKRPTANAELCDALLEGGFKTNADNFREVIRATLSRNPEFVKVNGRWALHGWYGGRGKRRRRSSTTTDMQERESESTEGETPKLLLTS